jgi:hypothetical protein
VSRTYQWYAAHHSLPSSAATAQWYELCNDTTEHKTSRVTSQLRLQMRTCSWQCSPEQLHTLWTPKPLIYARHVCQILEWCVKRERATARVIIATPCLQSRVPPDRTMQTPLPSQTAH